MEPIGKSEWRTNERTRAKRKKNEVRDGNQREGKAEQLLGRDLFVCWFPEGQQTATHDPGNT